MKIEIVDDDSLSFEEIQEIIDSPVIEKVDAIVTAFSNYRKTHWWYRIVDFCERLIFLQ